MTDSALEDYLTHGRFKEGLKQCEKRLKKNKPAVEHFVYKARFLYGLGQRNEAMAVITALTERTPSITDTVVLDEIDSFLFSIANDDVYPHVLTNGPVSNKLWSACFGTTPKSGIHHAYLDRLNGAVRDRRWQDAGTTLAGWRQTEPKRRDIRWIHIACLQVIADTSKDPMTSRINALQATKTIEKSLDLVKTEDDLLFVIDVLLRQNNSTLLIQLVLDDKAPLNILLRSSYEAFMRLLTYLSLEQSLKQSALWRVLWNWTTGSRGGDTSPFLLGKHNQERCRKDWRLYKAFVAAWSSVPADAEALLGSSMHPFPLPPNLRIDMVANMWIQRVQHRSEERLAAAKDYFDTYKTKPFCTSDLREIVLSFPDAHLLDFRTHIQQSSRAIVTTAHEDITEEQRLDFIATETNVLRLEYLLTISSAPKCTRQARFTFINNIVRLADLSAILVGQIDPDVELLMACSLWAAYERDQDTRHLLMALSYLYLVLDKQFCYPASVLIIAISKELGLGGLALVEYKRLNIKDIQLETASHIGLARISALVPLSREDLARHELHKALCMYEDTDVRIAEQQQSLLRAERPELLLQLEDMRRVLHHSINRRVLILEHRRVLRLRGQFPHAEHKLHPATIQMWTEDLEDRRDFNTLPEFEAADDAHKLERRLHRNGVIPDAQWILHNLWIDEICSLVTGDSLLVKRYIGKAPPLRIGSLTQEEVALTSSWEALAMASAITFLTKDEVGAAGWAGIDGSHAIGRLKEHIEDLPAQCTRYFPRDDFGFPTASKIQSVYLAMDLLQSAGRFAIAAQEVNKGKRTGKKTPQDAVNDMARSARQAFEDIRGLVSSSLERLTEDSVRSAMYDESELVGLGHVASADYGRWARHFCRFARGTWDEALMVRFPGV